jgi:hypothetical protein
MAYVSGGGANLLQKKLVTLEKRYSFFLLGSNVRGIRDNGILSRFLRATKWHIRFC